MKKTMLFITTLAILYVSSCKKDNKQSDISDPSKAIGTWDSDYYAIDLNANNKIETSEMLKVTGVWSMVLTDDKQISGHIGELEQSGNYDIADGHFRTEGTTPTDFTIKTLNYTHLVLSTLVDINGKKTLSEYGFTRRL